MTIDESQLDLSSPLWTALGEKLRAPDASVGQLKLGKRGVYLVDRSSDVTSFQLVPWEQLTADVIGTDWRTSCYGNFDRGSRGNGTTSVEVPRFSSAVDSLKAPV